MNPLSNEILIVAGEASGDLHGGALVRAIRERRPELRFFGIGGDRMSESGVRLIRHVRDMSFLGFFEVVKHLPLIRRVFSEMTNRGDPCSLTRPATETPSIWVIGWYSVLVPNLFGIPDSSFRITGRSYLIFVIALRK